MGRYRTGLVGVSEKWKFLFMKILALDVHYEDPIAWVGAILFAGWDSHETEASLRLKVDDVEPYQPGEFYKRELPLLLLALEQFEPDVIIVDAHVWLDEDTPGLGAHLHDAMGGEIPVIGVAKNPFRGSENAQHVVRHDAKPLYVTAAGMADEEAASGILKMAGEFRIPTMLKRVDHVARGHEA